MIRLLVPDMPSAKDLLPYLRRIDEAKVYVNRGHLVQELEDRLTRMTGVPCVTVANGTLGLELALQTVEIEFEELRPLVALPAVTFSATGLAAHAAEYYVDLYDVDAETWQLDGTQSYADSDCVMPVATFGMPVGVTQWENYPIPVVIDAAGAFPAQACSKDPNIITCFSLHATKFIGAGEGGFVACADRGKIERIRSLSMFGAEGTNAKMSEYHAAVALASLDRAQPKMMHTTRVAEWYRYAIAKSLPMLHRTSTLLVTELPVPAAEVIPKMLAAGIEVKQWYRPFLDERPEFGTYPMGTFPVTDHLREHLIGLPFHNFLTEADVAYVCNTLRKAIA